MPITQCKSLLYKIKFNLKCSHFSIQKHAPNGVHGTGRWGPGAVRVVLQEVDHGPPTVCSSRSGPAGRCPSQASRPRASDHSTPGAPGREAHGGVTADHLTVTSVETAELQSPWCGARPQACVHPQQVQRQAEQLDLICGLWGGGASLTKVHRDAPCGACAFPNFCLQKSLLKNLTTVFAKSKHSC